MATIQLRRGVVASLPALAAGEPGFCTDTFELYVGSASGNKLIGPGASGAHATTHENGGADEISVAGLSGLLADAQTPLAHNQAFSTITSTPTTLVGYGIVDAQPLDADLTALAGLTSAADRLPYFTGSGTATLATFTAAGRAILDDADATAQRVTLGLVIGTNVQAWDADLDALAAVTGTNTIYYRSAANTWTAVSIGTNITFSGGTLSSTGGSGTVTSVTINQPSAGLTVTNSGSAITTSGIWTFALANDLAALESLSGTNTIYYRSAADTWTAVTIGTNLTFSAGTLSSTGGVSDGDKGDLTVSGSGATYTIDAGVVTYAKIQNVSATSRILGRITAGAGSVEELTGTQATTLLNNFTSTLKGLAPLSGGGTVNFLRADVSWAEPPGAGTVNGSATLGGNYTLTTTQANSGLSITLPSAGTYLVIARVRFLLEGSGGTTEGWAKLRNSTDSSDLQSESNVVTNNNGSRLDITATVVVIATVAASKTIQLWARYGGSASSFSLTLLGTSTTQLLYHRLSM